MKGLTTFLLLAASILAGCNDKEPVQTTDWYKANTTGRLAMLERCKANPGEFSATPNCINASAAANSIMLGNRGYKQREPINFSSQEK
jgi:hypothetical protein